MNREQALKQILKLNPEKNSEWANYHLTCIEDNMDLEDFSSYDYTELVETQFTP